LAHNHVAFYAAATVSALCGIVSVADRVGGQGVALKSSAGADGISDDEIKLWNQ